MHFPKITPLRVAKLQTVKDWPLVQGKWWRRGTASASGGMGVGRDRILLTKKFMLAKIFSGPAVA